MEFNAVLKRFLDSLADADADADAEGPEATEAE